MINANIGVIFFFNDIFSLVFVGELFFPQEKQIYLFISSLIKNAKSYFFGTDFLENIY